MALYRCCDRQGLVHVTYESTWREPSEPEQATCGYSDYMDRVGGIVTCIECLVFVLTYPIPAVTLGAIK